MATRIAIGYQTHGATTTLGGRITAAYCHWGSGPASLLPTLEEHYPTISAVKALITPGSLSQLRTRETWDPAIQRDPQPLYHHERGDGPWCAQDGSYGDPPHKSRSIADAKSYWRDCGCEHLYLRSSNGWRHYPL